MAFYVECVIKGDSIKSNQISIPYRIEFILRIIGMWPGVSNISAHLIFQFFFTFSLTFQFWDAVLVHRDIILLTSSICPTLAELMFFLKYLILRKKRRHVTNVLSEIIEDCKRIETQNEENIIWNSLRYSQFFFVWTSFVYLIAGAFFVITAVTCYNSENREFIFESTFPFEADKSPVFEIIFCIHFFTIFVSSYGNAFLDSVFIMMILHASAKIDMVREEIGNFTKNINLSEEKKIRTSITKNLVERYQNVIQFTEKIEHIYSYQLLVQIILSTLEICVTGFTFIALTQDNSLEHVTITEIIKFMVIFMATLWVTAVYCTGGDYLWNKNELIQYDIYSSMWYELRPTDCKSLWILMIRSQKSMTITAGKFVNMTLENYAKIIKKSLSYLSVLQASVHK